MKNTWLIKPFTLKPATLKLLLLALVQFKLSLNGVKETEVKPVVELLCQCLIIIHISELEVLIYSSLISSFIKVLQKALTLLFIYKNFFILKHAHFY